MVHAQSEPRAAAGDHQNRAGRGETAAVRYLWTSRYSWKQPPVASPHRGCFAGTGKTVTVVESVLQIFVNLPHSRILVATPSNSSADLIAQRLVVAAAGAMNDSSGGLRGHLARLNAFQRREESVPEDIRDFCFASDTIDSLRNVVRHRIIVATCSTAGTLYKVN